MLMLLGIEITFQDSLSCLSCLDLLKGGGGGEAGGGKGVQHDHAPAHTALLTENVLYTNDTYIME